MPPIYFLFSAASGHLEYARSHQGSKTDETVAISLVGALKSRIWDTCSTLPSPLRERLPSSIGLCLLCGRSSAAAISHPAFLYSVAHRHLEYVVLFVLKDRQDRSQFLTQRPCPKVTAFGSMFESFFFFFFVPKEKLRARSFLSIMWHCARGRDEVRVCHRVSYQLQCGCFHTCM